MTVSQVIVVCIAALVIITFIIISNQWTHTQRQVPQRMWKWLSLVLNVVNSTACVLAATYFLTNSTYLVVFSVFLWHSGKFILYLIEFESHRSIPIIGASDERLSRFYRYALIPVAVFPFTSLVGDPITGSLSHLLFIGCCGCYIFLHSLCVYRFSHRFRLFLLAMERNEVDEGLLTELCEHSVLYPEESYHSYDSQEEERARYNEMRVRRRRLISVLTKRSILDLWMICPLIVVMGSMMLLILNVIPFEMVLGAVALNSLIDIICSALKFGHNMSDYDMCENTHLLYSELHSENDFKVRVKAAQLRARTTLDMLVNAFIDKNIL